MTDTIAPTTDTRLERVQALTQELANLRAGIEQVFDEIRAESADLVLHRPDSVANRAPLRVGDRAVRTIQHSPFGYSTASIGPGYRRRAIQADQDYLYVQTGIYELIAEERRPLDDKTDQFWVKVADVEVDEDCHRRAVSSLRNRSRTIGLRVRLRDRDIQLVDPMNNVIHEGTVLTGLAWVMEIDLDGKIWER